MNNLESKKLEEVVELIIDYRGKTPKKLGGDWSEVADGVPALSAKNIKGGQIVAQDAIRKVDREIYRKWMKEEIKKEDILLTSEAPMGESYFWNREDKIVLSQRLFAIRANRNVCVPRFLYLYFQSPLFQSELYKRASGSTASGIKQTQLIDTEILLPSLDAQNNIVNILTSFDDKIELNRKMNEVLEEMQKTIFRHWFVDFEFPWNFENNEFSWEGKPYKSSGGEMVMSESGEIPKEWRSMNMNEVFDFKGGAQPPKSTHIYEERSGYIRFIQNRDYASINNLTYIPISSRNKICNEYDILMDKYGEVGKIRHGIAGAYNVAMAKIVPMRENFNEYLRGYFSQTDVQRMIESGASASTRGSLNKLVFYGKKMIVPCNSVLQSYEQLTVGMIGRGLLLKEENSYLSVTRDMLLPRLMSGKLEVPVEK